jgi:hypothetical protein
MTVSSGITEPVRVYWENRRTTCEAVVLPGEEDVLLGAFPLEGLDLMVHPTTREVIGAHGDKKRKGWVLDVRKPPATSSLCRLAWEE